MNQQRIFQILRAPHISEKSQSSPKATTARRLNASRPLDSMTTQNEAVLISYVGFFAFRLLPVAAMTFGVQFSMHFW